MKFKKWFIKDPCKEGNCLVKASCRYPRQLPWERRDKCPAYNKYRTWDDRWDKWFGLAGSLFWGCIFLLLCIWAILTFILGVHKEYEYIIKWFF